MQNGNTPNEESAARGYGETEPSAWIQSSRPWGAKGIDAHLACLIEG